MHPFQGVATDTLAVPDAEVPTWEQVATTRWGAYVSGVEKRAILYGHQLAGEPRTALEVGCDGGRWSKMLADLGWRMICVDINSQALAICQQRIPTATCILARPEDRTLPCEEKSLGLLLCIEVLPISHAEWFFREAVRTLEDDGVLVIMTWNSWSLRGLFSYVRERLVGGFSFYETAYTTWKKRVAESGLRITYEEGFCWFPFHRASDSKFVPYAASAEKHMGLRRLTTMSPWVVVVLKKTLKKS